MSANLTATWRRLDRPLFAALAATALGGLVLGFCQHGYANADFVGYATVAGRVLTDPAASVTGYWAPLFSWLMVPLLALGADDLVAGRTVLLGSALAYVLAIDTIVRRSLPADDDRAFVRAGLLTVSAVQGVLWAGYLLDPDLLGATGIFATLALVAGGRTPVGSRRSLAIGAMAAVAYFGKSFQLPFLAIVIPVALWLLCPGTGAALLPRRLGMLRPIARPTALAWMAMVAVAAPWIAVLSRRHGQFTISTAGPAVHANVGPAVIGQDLLWNPPLESDFIVRPHFGPDWSPFDSWSACAHQLQLCATNLGRAAAVLAGPVLGLLLAALLRRHWQSRAAGAGLPAAALRLSMCAALAGLLYLGGYALIHVGRRYLLPTMAPLLLLCVFVLAAAPLRARLPRAGWLLPVGLALLLSAQELRLLWVTAVRHPQSVPMAQSRGLAAELRAAGLAELPFAASGWHAGLMVAYALGATERYFGTPRAATPPARAVELDAAGVTCFLDFGGDAPAASLPGDWRCVLRSTTARHDGAQVRVYCR